jgi:hypothetical protein
MKKHFLKYSIVIAIVFFACQYFSAQPLQVIHDIIPDLVKKKVIYSPDKKMSAYIFSAGKRNSPSTESRIEIRSLNGRVLCSQSYISKDYSHGMNILKGQWTQNSMYFVFNGCYSGGHQSGHFPTYFYSRNDNGIHYLDPFVGIWVTGDFTLTSEDSLSIRISARLKDGKIVDTLIKTVCLSELQNK